MSNENKRERDCFCDDDCCDYGGGPGALFWLALALASALLLFGLWAVCTV
jgi:hypothetical protein